MFLIALWVLESYWNLTLLQDPIEMIENNFSILFSKVSRFWKVILLVKLLLHFTNCQEHSQFDFNTLFCDCWRLDASPKPVVADAVGVSDSSLMVYLLCHILNRDYLSDTIFLLELLHEGSRYVGPGFENSRRGAFITLGIIIFAFIIFLAVICQAKLVKFEL